MKMMAKMKKVSYFTKVVCASYREGRMQIPSNRPQIPIY